MTQILDLIGGHSWNGNPEGRLRDDGNLEPAEGDAEHDRDDEHDSRYACGRGTPCRQRAPHA